MPSLWNQFSNPLPPPNTSKTGSFAGFVVSFPGNQDAVFKKMLDICPHTIQFSGQARTDQIIPEKQLEAGTMKMKCRCFPIARWLSVIAIIPS